MPGVSYRVFCVAALAGVLTGCGGIVPKGYQGKWSCTGPTLALGQCFRIEIDHDSVGWSKMSMTPAWRAAVDRVTPDGDGHWLHLEKRPLRHGPRRDAAGRHHRRGLSMRPGLAIPSFQSLHQDHSS